ncbi:hypothetical protein AMS68_003238 [Peltaster fructicola]|uniref:non-specific serine/threonine protein kinase n=1 Tax=Peltaster fructicola TaxID=286661 RepID=A0A6H0XST2_9PEZI|nr:hypothetical protein AMS68_003238 [Peltaster fructicola]
MGDLSLSQSLGGLRIANPDDVDPNASPPPNGSAAPPPLPSSRSSESTVTGHTLIAPLSHETSGQSGLDFDPATYTPQEPVIPQYREHADQFAGPPYPVPARRAMRDAHRPSSGIYNHQNTSSSSALSNQGYRSDLGSDIRRTTSRSSRQPMGQHGMSGAPIYRQSSQSNGGHGPLPPRRNSRRSRAPTGASETEGYPSSSPHSPSDWQERGAAVGTKVETDAAGKTVMKTVRKGVKDFNFGGTLGEGSYSTVVSATDRQTLKEYAIKVLDKRHIIKEKKVKYVNIERDTLNRLTDHPGIVRLYYTFQDERSLYFVLDLASGGELLGVLKKMGSFDIECTRFYGAQILDSIAYMHSRGVIHRDLKPENVLLDREMHVKITDFGTAKILNKPTRKGDAEGRDTTQELADTESDRAVSFVGTAEYVSPELLRDKSACKASDLWAFGCIVFQLIAGRPPFKAANEYLTFQKILGLEYTFPTGFPEDARDLVERLLVLDPAARLSIEHIRNHPFFEGITWGRGLWRQKAPRLKAYVAPSTAPIKLNGTSNDIAPAAAQQALAQAKTQAASRPQLRNITELPPPSQLDIDWSPVLVHNNERILKLGNLIVFQAAQPYPAPGSKGIDPGTPTEKPKFARFFSGNTIKKRERLILITSNARLIVAAAGGNEKKAKMDISFAASTTSWTEFVDPKGLTGWALDTKDKHFTFEDPRATTADPAGSKFCTQEWLQALEQAKELFLSNQQQSTATSYSADSMLNGLNDSSLPSSADSLNDSVAPLSGGHHLRQTLRKEPGDSSALDKGRRRFSKRHSKSGLAAVF